MFRAYYCFIFVYAMREVSALFLHCIVIAYVLRHLDEIASLPLNGLHVCALLNPFMVIHEVEKQLCRAAAYKRNCHVFADSKFAKKTSNDSMWLSDPGSG
jgi:hypothetical protein